MPILKASQFPTSLKNIYDPPKELYYQGQIDLLKKPALAIVGTRKYSDYGHYVTNKIVSELAAYDITILSGLALGIDSIAHRAALRHNLPTVAILGSGLSQIYPPKNASLAQEISQRGLLISEYPPNTQPLKHHFPQRNRLVSALSLGTLVIEAPEKSGALITARIAVEQGREVFTTPGDIDRQNSAGPLKLLQRSVAHPVSSGRQIMQILKKQPHLFPLPKPQTTTTPQNLPQNQQTLLAQFPANRTTTFERLKAKSGLSTSVLLSTLTLLEINGHIIKRNGKYRLKPNPKNL